MKKRLIILSDLWGTHNSDWVTQYIVTLKDYFEIQFYDSRELANMNTENTNQELIHQQFIQFGIDKAVTNLLEKEKEEVYVLAFSIGGTIAWKAALKGLNAKYICALSPTRLRLESEKPNIQIDLIFAKNDPNIPKKDWFFRLNIDFKLVKDKVHEFYRAPETAMAISQQLISPNL